MNLNKYELLFLLSISIERLGGGVLSSLPSLCLLDFSNLFNQNVDKIAIILSAKSFGGMCGSLFSPLYFYYQPGFEKIKPVTVAGICMILTSILVVISPLTSNLTVLFAVILLIFLFYGFLDLALQSMIIQMWGAKNKLTRSLVHFYHGIWAIGSIVGPYVTMDFVVSEEEDIDEICDIESGNSTAISNYYHHQQLGDDGQNEVPRVFWPWFITAVFWGVSGFLCIFMGVKGITTKISDKYQNISSQNGISNPALEDKEVEVEKSAETENPQQKLSHSTYWHYELPLILCIFLAYSFAGGAEHWFIDFAYEYAVCIKSWSTTLSSTLVSIFWAAFSISRFSGIILCKYIKPKSYITINFLTMLVAFILLCIFNQEDDSDTVLWIAAILLGAGNATMFANGITLASEYFDVTRLYSISFGLGNFAGQMLVPIGATYLLTDTKFFFILGTLICLAYAVPMGGLIFLGQYFRSRRWLRPEFC